MDTLTPDELNTLAEIPLDTLMRLHDEALQVVSTRDLVVFDRKVLELWYGEQKELSDGPVS